MYGFIIPTGGRQLLADLLAGSTLTITRVMFGSGSPAGDPADLTDLVRPVAAGTSTAPQVAGSVCSFVLEYRNDLHGGLETGFYMTEFGVYALDKEGVETLLYYGGFGDAPQYIPAYSEGLADVRRFPVSIALSPDMTVEIEYAPASYMTAEDVAQYFTDIALPAAAAQTQVQLTAHSTDPAAHPDIRQAVSRNDGRIGIMEDMLINDITGNDFMVRFDTLDGLTVTGVWNLALGRVEF